MRKSKSIEPTNSYPLEQVFEQAVYKGIPTVVIPKAMLRINERRQEAMKTLELYSEENCQRELEETTRKLTLHQRMARLEAQRIICGCALADLFLMDGHQPPPQLFTPADVLATGNWYSQPRDTVEKIREDFGL